MKEYVHQKPEVPDVQLFVSLGNKQYVQENPWFPCPRSPGKGGLERGKSRPLGKGQTAPFNRPEMLDKEPGSFGFLVNLQAYRAESFAFLPEIQGNQAERVYQGKPKVFLSFPKEGKN